MQKNITIVGAGLVGSLEALYLTKRGHKVTIFERRNDLRSEIITAGKSINLALSERGWTALKKVGIHKEVMEIAIPMGKRIMHDTDGILTEQDYGTNGEAIYSVSRVELNVLMMKLASKNGATLHFNEKCIHVDLEDGNATFENTNTSTKQTVSADLVIGADGAFSAVRKQMVKNLSQKYSYNEIDHDYKELLIPAGKNRIHLLNKNALHIWPRGNFMLIALANLDGSFTCTLFAPKTGKDSFEKLNSKEEVDSYFQKVFPDFTEMTPNLYEQWENNPTSSLGIVKTYPWHIKDTTLLIGDAAHATVPFYGQGMNSGMEDCTVMWDLMQKHKEDWPKVFAEYQELRKPDGDGVQDLSLHNYYVMRDYVGDPKFLLQKKIEAHFSAKHPDKWLPLYSQVTFSDIRYSVAWKTGQKQDAIMKTVMAQFDDIENVWESEGVEQAILAAI